jgi:nitrate/TMAO reductase-like tetraheme cytochrome c subunit
MMPGRAAFSAEASPEFTLRKMVNPSETCLLCHGAYPAANMGLEGSWHDLRVDMETAEAPNGCLSCHAETFRTNRHQVNYLNAATIEDIARNGTSDSCFGCHGGRQWYRISYPYARTPWPGMDTETVPDWAVDRPTASKPEHQIAP